MNSITGFFKKTSLLQVNKAINVFDNLSVESRISLIECNRLPQKALSVKKKMDNFFNMSLQVPLPFNIIS